MASNNLHVPPPKVVATGGAEPTSAAAVLAKFPHLVQLVRDGRVVTATEDNQTDVAEIAAAKGSDDAVAQQFGTTAEHVAEARRYVVEATPNPEG